MQPGKPDQQSDSTPDAAKTINVEENSTPQTKPTVISPVETPPISDTATEPDLASPNDLQPSPANSDSTQTSTEPPVTGTTLVSPSAELDKPQNPVTTPSTDSATTPQEPTSMPTSNSDETSTPTSNTVVTSRGNKLTRRWLLPLAILLIILILATGYVFAFYIPSRPGSIFKESLQHSAAGYDSLVSYIKQSQAKNNQGTKVDGAFKVAAPSFSSDASVTLQSYKGNATGSINLDIAGQKASLNIRSIKATGQNMPDSYIQPVGIKKTLDDLGLTKIDNLDGQWIAIDHTLLDHYAGIGASAITAPTQAQITDALSKLSQTNRDYLFSTAGSKAVLTNKKYLGKSSQDGRSVYGYTVGVNESHLKAYVAAVASALDNSGLNDWVKKTTNKSISNYLAASDVSVPANFSFTLYVDAKTKLPHKLHFTDSMQAANYLELGLNYTGGSSYPLTFKVVNANDTMLLSLTLDTASDKISGGFTVDTASSTGHSPTNVASGTFAITPNNSPVTVSVPPNAKPLLDVINSLGLSANLPSAGSSSTINTLFNVQ